MERYLFDTTESKNYLSKNVIRCGVNFINIAVYAFCRMWYTETGK
nr:MAG TPA: hypothetical protein [Caudoviricetes sp.]